MEVEHYQNVLIGSGEPGKYLARDLAKLVICGALIFLVLLMRRTVAEKGAHIAAE